MGGQFLGGYNTNSRMASKSQCFNSDCGRRAEHPEPLSEEKRAEKWNDIGEERTMRSWPSSYRLAVAKCRRKKSLQTWYSMLMLIRSCRTAWQKKKRREGLAEQRMLQRECPSHSFQSQCLSSPSLLLLLALLPPHNNC